MIIRHGYSMSTTSYNSNPILRAWYDKETRSVIVQVIAMAIILAFFAYVINNAVINMANLGKDISFSFLWQPASYDINQTLIEYSSRSSHFDAMIVGLINTLLWKRKILLNLNLLLTTS